MKDQDRRTLLAMVLALATYYVWTIFFLQPTPEQADPAAQAGETSAPAQPGASGASAAPALPAPEFPCTDARTAFGQDVRFSLSDCGDVRAIELPAHEAAVHVTPWWTWLWGRVTGTHSGAWAPYHGAGTAENLVKGRFGVAGVGDPLAPPADSRWTVTAADTGATAELSTPLGLRVRRTLTPTAEPDLYDLTWRWEAAAGAQGPFWVGLQEELQTSAGPYDPHLRLAAVIDGDLEQLFDPADAVGGTVWEGPVSWFGLEDRYFLAALQPQDPLTDLRIVTGADGQTRAWVRAPKDSLAPGESVELRFRLYVGAKEVERMATLGGGLEEAANLGFFGFFSKILLFFLDLFYMAVHNWGVAIVCLTFFIRACLYPIASRAFESAKAMQLVQPKMKEIQEQYADNKEQLNLELMKLFQEHKVNPFGGCLPMFIQMPVFFALFSALQVTPKLYHQPFWYIQDLSAPDPFGIFPAFMTAGMYVQQQLTPMTGMDPAQQRIMKYMPLMFGLFMFTTPAGLTVYYAVNTILSILQQWHNMRRFQLAAPKPA